MAADETTLVCRVAHRLCALPLTHVRETMRPLPVEAVAGVIPPITGVAIIRGAAVPVVDLGRLISGDPSDAGRFVTVRVGDRSVALVVDAVVGIRAIPRETSQALPLLLHEADHDAVVRIGTLDAELLLVLEDSRIVPEAAWQALDRAPDGLQPNL